MNLKKKSNEMRAVTTTLRGIKPPDWNIALVLESLTHLSPPELG